MNKPSADELAAFLKTLEYKSDGGELRGDGGALPALADEEDRAVSRQFVGLHQDRHVLDAQRAARDA